MDPILIALAAAAALAGLAVAAGSRGPEAIPVKICRRPVRGRGPDGRR